MRVWWSLLNPQSCSWQCWYKWWRTDNLYSGRKFFNSRPLTYQTANPDDNLVLTPNHFYMVNRVKLSLPHQWMKCCLVIRHDGEEYKNWLDMYGRDGFNNFYQHLENKRNGTKRKRILPLVIQCLQQHQVLLEAHGHLVE